MLDLRAFSDESITRDQGPRTFCIAGYVASAAEWEDFEIDWKRALAAEKLTEFKAANCEAGKREYARRGRAECDRIWRRFAGILTAMRTIGFGTIIDLDAYDGLAGLFKVGREEGFDDPYLLAFQHQAEMMAMRMSQMRRTERLALIFDKRSEAKADAIAKDLYDLLKRSRKLTFVDRLGDLAFLDSKCSPGLQAADLLAYEVRRHFWEVVIPTEPRLLALTRMSPLSLTGFHGGDLVRSTATRWRWQLSAEIAKRISVCLWLLIHQEQPTQAQLRVLDGYPVRWHLPSWRHRALLRSDCPSLWCTRRDRLTCHS